MESGGAMNRLCRSLGIESPIVLGPFGGMSSTALVAAVSEAGGLGSYGLYGLEPARIREIGSELRDRTSRPFALNLWLPYAAPGETAPSREAFDREIAVLKAIFDSVGIEPPEWPMTPLPDFESQLDAVLEVGPAAISFVFGVPSAQVIAEAHERGIAVIGTATTVDEARALDAAGVDVVVASGSEAAGHRTSFLEPAGDSLVGGLSLIPQAVDAVEVPVIAAGGIADRRGVAAAFALGAEGVQVGTAFLATRESAATDGHRDAIRSTAAHRTVLTRAMSGRLSRGAVNEAVRAIEASGAIASFPLQNALTGVFRRRATELGRTELLSLWMGQSAALARADEAATVFAELAEGVPYEW